MLQFIQSMEIPSQDQALCVLPFHPLSFIEEIKDPASNDLWLVEPLYFEGIVD